MKRYIVEVTQVRIYRGSIEARSSQAALTEATLQAKSGEYPMDTIDLTVEVKEPEALEAAVPQEKLQARKGLTQP